MAWLSQTAQAEGTSTMPKPPHTFDDPATRFSQAWFDKHAREVTRADGPAFVQLQSFPQNRSLHMYMMWANDIGQAVLTVYMTITGPGRSDLDG